MAPATQIPPASTMGRSSVDQLIHGVRQGNEADTARLISLIENGGPVVEEIEAKIQAVAVAKKPHRVGITGAVGVGKSSLVEEMIREFRRQGKRVAAIAVDPTSPVTGGAILADRMRLSPDVVLDPGVFYRSMASRGGTGGIAKATANVARLFDIFGIDSGKPFDLLLIETEGVGQSQKAIRRITDTMVAALIPGAGDLLTLSKDSYLNVADILVVNKADRKGADETQQLAERVFQNQGEKKGWPVPVIATIAMEQSRKGIAELVQNIDEHRAYLAMHPRQPPLVSYPKNPKGRVLVLDSSEKKESLAMASGLRDQGFEVVYLKCTRDDFFDHPFLLLSTIIEEGIDAIYFEVRSNYDMAVLTLLKDKTKTLNLNLFVQVHFQEKAMTRGLRQEARSDGRFHVLNSNANATQLSEQIVGSLKPKTPLTIWDINRALSEIELGQTNVAARFMGFVEDELNENSPLLTAVRKLPREAYRIGITGPPGVGKSSLVSKLAKELRASGLKVGIIAVDPSNSKSGGALLIDRYRMQEAAEIQGIMIRSLGLRGEEGGIARATDPIARLMEHAGMGVILIESEGTGQTQDAIKEVVDTTVLVLSPAYLGDIQTMKAGSMETLDICVLNKSDTERSFLAFRELTPGLASQPARSDGWKPRAVQAVAVEGKGIDELLDLLTIHFDHLNRKASPPKWKKVVAAPREEDALTRREPTKEAPTNPLDRGDLPQEEKPGEYPFTGGIFPSLKSGAYTPRQYAGCNTAEETGERFRLIQQSGNPSFSLAFQNATQIGVDSNHPTALYNIGTEGAPVDSIQDMQTIFQGINILDEKVSTSMTINASAAPVLAIYIAVAVSRLMEKGMPKEKALEVVRENLRGTVQNDNTKERTTRNNFGISAEGSARLTNDMFEWNAHHLKRWNTISISGYHMREAGCTPAQEVAFTLTNAILYAQSFLKNRREGSVTTVNELLEQFSFFFDSFLFDETGEDFVYEVAKFRAARRLWAKIARHELKATDDNKQKALKLRFHTQTSGVPLRSDPKGREEMLNVVRILFEGLAAIYGGTQTLHLDAYDEATRLPTEHSVRIALRSHEILRKVIGENPPVDLLKKGGTALLKQHVAAIEEAAYQLIREEMNFQGKQWSAKREVTLQRAIHELVTGKLGSLENAEERLDQFTDQIEREAWEQIQVLMKINDLEGAEGVAQYVRDAIQEEVLKKGMLRDNRVAQNDSPEMADLESEKVAEPITEEKLLEKMFPYDQRRAKVIAALETLERQRDLEKVKQALNELREAALENKNTMPYFIEAALAGATVGEMMDVMRGIFGDYKKGVFPAKTTPVESLPEVRSLRPVRIFMAKPGLDGHDRGINLVSAILKNAGLEVIYGGLRQTPEMIARAAVQENVDFIGLSSLSGARLHFIQDLMAALYRYGAEERIKVIVGGITEEDGPYLTYLGVDHIFDPSYGTGELHQIIAYIQRWADRVVNRVHLPFVEEPAQFGFSL